MTTNEAAADPVRAALEQFCADIEATGGLAPNDDDAEAPVGDPTWSDLAATYRNACKVLGRTPLVAEDDEDDDA